MAAPCQEAHQQKYREGERNRVLLEAPDQIETVHADPDLDDHDQGHDDELQEERVFDPEVPEDGDGEDDREVRVDPDPGHRHEELHPRRQVAAPPAERRTGQHHLIDSGLVTHHGHGREDPAADDVADHHDQDGLRQTEAQHDAERAEDPVDRRDVGPGPDPELLPAG